MRPRDPGQSDVSCGFALERGVSADLGYAEPTQQVELKREIRARVVFAFSLAFVHLIRCSFHDR